ncbi:hypothetical protein, partial [Brevibacillus brevis]|uniref:hypothetical protein n=1 Tax=Brevibacillus brevis TaxID=1393 RepID=UPI0037CC8C01
TAFFGLNRIIEKERVSFTYTATKSGFLQDSHRKDVFLGCLINYFLKICTMLIINDECCVRLLWFVNDATAKPKR